MNLEDCSGCGLDGWQWQDNGWGSGVLGPSHLLRHHRHPDAARPDTRGRTLDRSRAAVPIDLSQDQAARALDGFDAPASTSTSSATLKVLDWNTHHGVGTDGKYNLTRIATTSPAAAPTSCR